MSKKSKLTLIIDGNWLLMSRSFVIKNKISENNEKEFSNELQLLMLKSITVVLNTFPDIDNIIFVSDGGSWRNYIEKPKFLEYDYKGNRVKDDNFKLIFSIYENFVMKLRDNGINVFHEPGIEGDDWTWYWSQKLNNENTNVIIWSKDKDLMQLVKTNKDKCFTIWWNKDNGLYTDINKEEKQEDDFRFFFNPSVNNNETLFNKICDKCQKVNQVSINEIVIDKIIKGDISDNILPIIQKKSKTGDKLYRISNKDINYDLNISNDEEVKKFINEIYNSKTYFNKIIHTEEEIFEHFKYNKKLIQLNEDNYPKEVLDVFEKYKEYNCNKNIANIINELNAEKSSVNNILELI